MGDTPAERELLDVPLALALLRLPLLPSLEIASLSELPRLEAAALNLAIRPRFVRAGIAKVLFILPSLSPADAAPEVEDNVKGVGS